MDLANVNIRGTNMRAENDKNVYAVLAVYRNPKMREARVSFSVFSSEKKGAPLFEAQMSRAWVAATHLHWNEILTSSKEGEKFTATVSKRVRDQNGFKSEKLGTLTYGLDRGGAAYVGVTTDQGAFKFPLRTDPNYTYSDELPQKELNKIGVKTFLDAIDAYQRLADQCMLAPAEQGEGGGGGGRGGYNGGGGGGWKGRNNNGGGGRSNYGGGNGGNSSKELDDEIAF